MLCHHTMLALLNRAVASDLCVLGVLNVPYSTSGTGIVG